MMLTLPERYCKSFPQVFPNCLKYRKKRKRELRRYPLIPPPATNFTLVKVCQLVLCYKNITVFSLCTMVREESRHRAPPCTPVSAFAAGQERVPRPAAAANVKPLCGAFRDRKDSPDSCSFLSKRNKYPTSKTEQEKGGWSCATSRHPLRPAVLGVSELPT